jgi:hypothetical protein
MQRTHATQVPPFLVGEGAGSSSYLTASTYRSIGWIPHRFTNVNSFYHFPLMPRDAEALMNGLETTVKRAALWENRASPHIEKQFEYLPVDMISYPGYPAKVICVLDKNYHHSSSRRISQQLWYLFEFMVCNHCISSSQIGTKKYQREKEYLELMSWLKNILHNPKDSLPVFGEVKSYQLNKTFGPVQRWLIWYLHHQDTSRYGYTTSIALLYFWYRSQAPESWEKLEIRRKELGFECFWSFMHYTAEKPGPGAGWYKVKAFDSPYSLPSSLGELPARTFKALTHPFNDLIIKFTHDPEEIKIHNAMINEIHEAYKPYKPMDHVNSDHDLKRFFGIYALLEPFKHNQTTEKMFAIRLTYISGEMIPFKELQTSLQNLLESCRWWHQNLNLGLKAKGVDPIPNAHRNFLQWMIGILFGKKYSLPVFGIIDERIYELFDGQPGFTAVQRFLINHLTSSASSNQVASEESTLQSLPSKPSTLATDSIMLIVYWYHSKLFKFWNQHLNNNENCVLVFIDGLRINQKSHCFSRSS